MLYLDRLSSWMGIYVRHSIKETDNQKSINFAKIKLNGFLDLNGFRLKRQIC